MTDTICRSVQGGPVWLFTLWRIEIHNTIHNTLACQTIQPTITMAVIDSTDNACTTMFILNTFFLEQHKHHNDHNKSFSSLHYI